ncbi:MAG: glutamyl-tRNA reductase [Phycisphaerae bacterium]|nr:glutamyl-tRNA reductase [Phycisphaerae bacterium]
MRILCFGISHKTAPLEMREQLAFDSQATQRALTLLHKQYPEAEFLLLSTCNRTELYIVRPLHGHPREDQLLGWLRKFHSTRSEDFTRALYTYYDTEAMGHMFSVAAGLDSQVPGEDQIVSQLKQAYTTAEKTGTTKAAMRNLIDAALRAAKQVRNNTPISQGKVSVASVALECIYKTFSSLKNKRVLSIGAGKISEIILRELQLLKPRELIVANRSLNRAQQLAAACNARVIPLEDIGSAINNADVVVTCTASKKPIITTDMLRSIPLCDNKKPLLMIDLGVPRDIEPTAGELPNVDLHNIDDLQSIIDETIEVRKDHIESAREIIAEHVREFMDRMKIRDVIPTIDSLYKRIDAVVECELAAPGNRGLSAAESENLRCSLRRSLRQFCHPAVENLRKSVSGPIGSGHANVIRKIFGLDDEQ